MIQFKGYDFELVNSTFKDAYASTNGGAILVKYFPRDGSDSGNVATAPFLFQDVISLIFPVEMTVEQCILTLIQDHNLFLKQ